MNMESTTLVVIVSIFANDTPAACFIKLFMAVKNFVVKQCLSNCPSHLQAWTKILAYHATELITAVKKF